MSKEKKIQEYESKQLIDELSKMPPMVIATAYLHAINYTLYGEDVTEKWVTAVQYASALEKAHRKGYHDALQRQSGHCKDCKWWKDNDGTFRRGVGAESRCPINRIEVFEGNGYCYMFEPQERSDKE